MSFIKLRRPIGSSDYTYVYVGYTVDETKGLFLREPRGKFTVNDIAAMLLYVTPCIAQEPILFFLWRERIWCGWGNEFCLC